MRGINRKIMRFTTCQSRSQKEEKKASSQLISALELVISHPEADARGSTRNVMSCKRPKANCPVNHVMRRVHKTSPNEKKNGEAL